MFKIHTQIIPCPCCRGTTGKKHPSKKFIDTCPVCNGTGRVVSHRIMNQVAE